MALLDGVCRQVSKQCLDVVWPSSFTEADDEWSRWWHQRLALHADKVPIQLVSATGGRQSEIRATKTELIK